MTVWLSVVGVGLDGADSLNATARSVVEGAEVVAGSERLLDLLDIEPERRYAWPSPFSDGLAHVTGLRGQRVAVLATGDPMHFGVGATLARDVPVEEMRVFPAPSAFSLAAGRMGWALQDTRCVSLHGRPLETLYAELGPGLRLLILTSDGDAPSEIMSLLMQAGYGASRVSILENLGGRDEQRLDLAAEEHSFASYADLNMMAVACVGDEDMQYLPRVPGLPNGAFLHDGQMTKRDVRAATVAALVPTPGQRLWDVGAGCGSVAVEWLRSSPQGSAVAFERDDDRVGMIEQNALRLGVPNLAVVHGNLPEAMEGQARPDVIFHGGAISNDAVFEACWQALGSGGRLVANAVTLEGETALAVRHKSYGGELLRIAVSECVAVGQMRGMRPAMAVMQWRVTKP